MANLCYPLICWQLPERLILGQVIGTQLKAVDQQLSRLKMLLGRQLRFELQADRAGEPRIRQARLRQLKMPYRSAHHEMDGIYPLPFSVELPVVVVWGESGEGRWECFLPQFEESFFLQDAGQLDLLSLHFAREAIQDWPPEKLQQLFLPALPWLEEVAISRPVKQAAGLDGGAPEWMRDRLAAMADPYPLPREGRGQRHIIHGVWERAAEVEELRAGLARHGSNILLAGERGVGKTAILEEAIRLLLKDSKEVPLPQRPVFWRTSPSRMLAGARYLGEWQEHCEELVEALSESRGVLWITHFLDLFRSGGEESRDSVAAYLLPEIRRGRLRVVAEATPRELEAARTLLPGFAACFETIAVAELLPVQMKRVLENFAAKSRQLMDTAISPETLGLIYRLLDRHVRYERFPGKAVVFLTTCLDEARRHKTGEVDSGLALRLFGEQTGLPEILLRDDLLLDADALQSWFERRIIGQPRALQVMTSVVKVFKAGLHHPGKPVSCLVFAGPTGTGKTAAARALAEYFFGQGQKTHPLIRLDMSEYQHPFQLDRLIGSRRRGEPGELVRRIRERPFSVLLLDEAEKAHPAFFDVLLAVLDEGRLADAFGRETSFCNTIIIFTTNLGSGAATAAGFTDSQPPGYASVVKQFFRPEFFNRIDEVVDFRPLSPEIIAAITRKELAGLEERPGFRNRDLRLTFGEELIARVAREGFSPAFGARPLQRAIERVVVNPLARLLIRGHSLTGRTLHLDEAAGQLVIRS